MVVTLGELTTKDPRPEPTRVPPQESVNQRSELPEPPMALRVMVPESYWQMLLALALMLVGATALGRPQSYYDSASWRGTWEFDGGAFMNQASHYIDLLDWICGPVESVMAYTGTLARNIEVEDTGVAALKWRNGAMGSINVTMLTWPKNLEGSITILGERGTVRIGGVAVNEIKHWEFETPDAMDSLIGDASYETTSVYGFGHPLYYDNVISTLRGEAQPETDGREGLKSLELLIAMYLSARDGKRINLPLAY